MTGYLELGDGALIGVKDGAVLGRVAGCDIVVDDSKASRRHARLIVDAGVVEIEDLQSSNGTLLNGKPVERRVLRDGDQIQIGKTVIVYREGALPGRSKAASNDASASRPAFDDDDDLLTGDAPAKPGSADPGSPLSAAAEASPPPSHRPAPSPAPTSPAPPSPPANVVEFEDEVIEVRRPERPAAAAQPTKPSKQPADVVASSQRVLQFSKKAGGSNPLGDDLSQMPAGLRALIVLLVLAAGIGIAYAAFTAMQ